MKLYQRIGNVVAQDGISGLYRRGVRKLFGNGHHSHTPNETLEAAPAPVAEQYTAPVEEVVPAALAIPAVEACAAAPAETCAVQACQAPAAEVVALVEAAPAEPIDPFAEVKIEYARLTKNFNEETQRRGLGDFSNHYWYHTIDLGNGLVTPGVYDYRDVIASFGFPADMTGMKVLDVGSATGFFAFEFEKRGAHVTSVELPSLIDWDIVTVDKKQVMEEFLACYQGSMEQAYRLHLRGPFQFCHDQLKSKVERCYSKIYDLTPEKLGGGNFDLIFAGDVLIHVFSPLLALDRLAALCKSKLIVSYDLTGHADMAPFMYFVGAHPEACNRAWWLPNQQCMEQMMRKVGFKNVSVAGTYSGALRGIWANYHRTVFHATR